MSKASDSKNAEEIAKNNIVQIKKEAEKIIKKYGYNYNVAVNIGNFRFPTKTYENVTFPKGNYNALKVVIGKGEGKNWWCVLYPQLCFAYGNGTLSAENDNKLKKSLSKDGYTIVTAKGPVNIKLKILEWFSY